MRLDGHGLDHIHIPKLIEDVLGAKSVIIAGYQGAGDIDVALERGELQCRLITIAAFFGREPHITWYKKGFTRPLVQTGQTRSFAAGHTHVLRADGSLQNG